MPGATWSEDLQLFVRPYADAWQMGLVSLLVWGAIHLIASKVVCPMFDVTYGASMKDSDVIKGKKVKADSWYTSHANFEASVKITALVHALVSSSGSLFAILSAKHLIMSTDTLYDQDALQRLILGISCGYFLYDFIIALSSFDIPFLIHGGMSSIIYLHAYGQSFCLQLGCFFLLYEFSTIFLNIRAIMIASGNGKHKFFPLIEKLFFGTFMFFRMVLGLGYSIFVTIPVLTSLVLSGKSHSDIATILFIVANIAINGLNVMWSKAMIDILLGRGKRDSKPAATISTTSQPPQDKKAD